MTPLLPPPEHYLFNLITMTSPDAKRLWRRAIKEHFNCTCVYCGNNYEIHELTLDHVKPKTNDISGIAIEGSPLAKLAAVMPQVDPELVQSRLYGRKHS